MLISVIMITHNREKMVHNMIEDVLGQTYRNFEFIIIDNCSVDMSSTIVDEYAQKDERVIVKHLPDSVSIGAARNIGISLAKGQYITFVDDDDRIETDYLDYLFNHTNNGMYDISVCNSEELCDGKRKLFVAIDKDELLSNIDAVMELLKRRKIRSGIPAKLIRRELLLKHPIKEDAVHEDVHVMYRYLADSNGVFLGKEKKYFYVRHETNISSFLTLSRGFSRNDIIEYYNAYLERKAYLEKRFPNIEEYLIYNVASYMISMCDKINRYDIPDCEKVYDKMLSYLIEKDNELIVMKYATVEETEKYIKIINKSSQK